MSKKDKTAPVKNPDDYDVGYGRPPTKTRFKPGQSGNPKGRPKGRKSLRQLLDDELASKITLTENGTHKVMSKAEALVKSLTNRALKGDARSTGLLMQVLAMTARVDWEGQDQLEELDPVEQELLAEMLGELPDPSGAK